MTQEIRTRLLLMADAQYGSFSKSLIPECKPLLGVRLPALRKMAQEFVKNKEWKELVQTDGADDVYFEEAMLRGMLIGYGTKKSRIMKKQCGCLINLCRLLITGRCATAFVTA